MEICAEEDSSPSRTPAQRAAVWCEAAGGGGEDHLGAEGRTPWEVSLSGRPRYRAGLEWPGLLTRQEEWYRRGFRLCLFRGDKGVLFLVRRP